MGAKAAVWARLTVGASIPAAIMWQLGTGPIGAATLPLAMAAGSAEGSAGG